MKDLQELLNKVNKAKTYQDIFDINPAEKVKDRLDQLAVDPETVEKKHTYDRVGLERLMGVNNLMDVSFFRKGWEVAQTVCRIIYMRGQQKNALGTGFMVSPCLMMTNNHVIGSRFSAKRLFAEFDYENDDKGKIRDSHLFQFDPEAFFITNIELDYSIVAVNPLANNDPKKKLTDYGHNLLSNTQDRVLAGEPVSIIQHPKGLPKMIAIRENKVIKVDSPFIHYTTDTESGSSGSLVANDQWEIIALHRASVPERDGAGNKLLRKGGVHRDKADEPFINWIANEGVLIDCILEDVKSRRLEGEERERLRGELLVGFRAKGSQ